MDTTAIGLNICVVVGTVRQPPEWRTLPSGGSVTSFDLKVPDAEGRSQTLRVSWHDAPASAMELDEDAVVLVRGRLRSYWAGRSVLDFSATDVVPLSSSTRVRKKLAATMADLQQACP